MMSILRGIIIFLLILITSFFLAIPAADLIKAGGSFGDFRFFVGFPLVYLFLISALYLPFGGSYRYWWIVLTMIPGIIYELYFQLDFIYIPAIFAVLGWLVGYGISKLKPLVLKK